MQYSAQLYGRLEAETGQATEWKPVGSLRLASSEERWSELKRMATTARSFDFELHTLSPKEARGEIPADRSGGRGRRGVRAQRRLGRAVQPHHGLCQGRAGGRRAHRRGRAGDGLRVGWPAPHARADRPGRHRLRDRGQCRRHLGARRGEDGGRASAGRRRRAPVHDHRKEQLDPDRPADAARSRQHLLSQARARGAGRRRLGKGHADLRRHGRPLLVRPRAVPAQPGPARGLPAAGRRAPADPERARHPHGDQRPHPDLARRRADHGAGARARQFLRRLRLHLGHRRLRRRRQGDGGMDRRGRARARSVGLRRAPLRQPSHEREVPGRAQRRQLLALLPDPLSDRGASTPRAAAGARRSIRCWPPRTPCSARASAGSGPTGSRPPAARRSTSRPSRRGPTGSARSATNAAPRASAPC